MPEENYIIEPSAKDNGPAVGLALAHIHHQDPDATIAILAADHHIGKVGEFQRALRGADEVAQDGYIVTLGITPAFASTGFGYIERGDKLCIRMGLRCSRRCASLKSQSRDARNTWLDGRRSWNSGMFIYLTWRES